MMTAVAEITIKLDDALPEFAAVVAASLKLFDCQCEFEGDLGACSEWQESWDSAVIALKSARDKKALEQEDERGRLNAEMRRRDLFNPVWDR